jgi:hypothetical protein
MLAITNAVKTFANSVCDHRLLRETKSEKVCYDRLIKIPVIKISKMLMFAIGTNLFPMAPMSFPGCSRVFLALGRTINKIKNIPPIQMTAENKCIHVTMVNKMSFIFITSDYPSPLPSPARREGADGRGWRGGVTSPLSPLLLLDFRSTTAAASTIRCFAVTHDIA